MSSQLSILLDRARSVPYYNILWGKSNYANFAEYPLADKKLFVPNNLSSSLAVPEKNISYYYFSAGSTGNPKMIPFTAKEWAGRVRYRGECYKKAGVTKNDRVAILLSFGPWIAGPSAQDALLQLGCTVFPIGQLSEDEEIVGLFSIFERHKINILVTAPSLAQRFAYVYAKRKGKHTVKLDKIITSGEFITDTLKKQLQQLFGAETFSSYASSESFIGIECRQHNGFHYNPDEVFIETLDDKNRPKDEGGNIIISVLGSSAIPIVRYPMGDLGAVDITPCSCGNSWPKILWKGRTHEAFSVAGQVSIRSYQLKDAFARSGILVTRCEIELLEREAGKDLVVFNLYTINQLNSVELEEKEKALENLLKHSSMDFNDVIHQNIVKLKVILRSDLGPRVSPKTKIKVCDKREHVR